MADYGLRELRCLDALLRERHVSRAAFRLGMSQPAMSMALARLRDIFGDPLLVRRGNALAPTPYAEELHGRVQSMIRELEDLPDSRRAFDPARSERSFTLILTDYIDTVLMPGLVARLEASGARVSIRVVGPDPLRFGDLFGEGEVDLTVSYFPNAPRSLVSRKAFEDRMVCLVRRGHPAFAAPLSVEAFCALGHVAIEPSGASMYRVLLDDALAGLGLTRRIAVSKPGFQGVPYLLEASDLVATMPARLATLFAARFGLECFEPPVALPPLDIRMMWHRRTQNSAPHRWLRDQVLAVLKNQDGAPGMAAPAGRGKLGADYEGGTE
jgi:DNA-binding transcriptional LysR family regulator